MATGRFVFGSARGWRSARRFRLWLGIPNAVLRRDDQKSRFRTRDPLSCVHVTSVRLLALICLTFFSSWTYASDAGPGPSGSYPSSLFSNRLPALQTSEVAAQVEGDGSADDHSAKAARSSPWPCRLIVPPSLHRVVTAGWEHSATFRAQCRRLAEAHAIVMLSAFTLPRSRPANARISVYSDGSVLARVDVPLNARTLELVAHELEHVLEQVDGVNLAMQAALSRSLTSRSGMVVRLPGGEFETRRAIEAGLRVAAEFRSATAGGR
jgi:hypothetical protein